MERPSYTRADTDAVGGDDKLSREKSIEGEKDSSYGQTSSADAATVPHEKSKDGIAEITPYHDIDAESFDKDDAESKEVLSTADDLVTHIIHVDDDTSLNPW